MSSLLCAKKSESAVARHVGPSEALIVGAVAVVAQLRGIGPAAVVRVIFTSTLRAQDDK